MDRNMDERITIEQLGFLSELERYGKKRGAVETISKKFGLVHSKVSRFFKSCVQNEILTEDFKFTEKGRNILAWNKKLERDIRNYLLKTGAIEGIDSLTKALFENADYEALYKMVSDKPKIETDISRIQKAVATDITSVISRGRHKIRIGIFHRNEEHKVKRSMAERGFEKYAWLVYEEDECYIELIVKEMSATSRLCGKLMTGHLSSLKYLDTGTVRVAEIEDGRVRIPLNACVFENFGKGIIWGNVLITVACSVGRAHMPESTARLMFVI